MDKIPAKAIVLATKKILNLSPHNFSALLRRMGKEQPNIVGYLALSADEEELDEDETTFLMLLGAVIWQGMASGRTPLPRVTEDTVNLVMEDDIRHEEYINKELETGFSLASHIQMENYRQREAFEAIEALVLSASEQGLIDEDVSQAFLAHIKTVIGCFDTQQ